MDLNTDDGDWDWIQLDTGEWLKGSVRSMYDNDLELDSDHFGIITINWNDVSRLYTAKNQSIRFRSNQNQRDTTTVKPFNEAQPKVAEGKLALECEIIRVTKDENVSSSTSPTSPWKNNLSC